MSQPVRRVAVYGSLRKGEYNYNAFQRMYGDDALRYQRTTTIPGWTLFSLGSYPGIKKATDPDQELTVDLMEVSERAYQSINGMELGAGYNNVTVEIDGTEYTLYEYAYNRLGERVSHGDWSRYLREKAQALV